MPMMKTFGRILLVRFSGEDTGVEANELPMQLAQQARIASLAHMMNACIVERAKSTSVSSQSICTEVE